ncbi:MAG: Asp-tRNA(Asn)/Glu-tRNA(Gln) amidotransferase GatCAB subunit C [Deltaproteobacteria bacterium]|nr:MAG: Asp-tRNA(Asn)/Glu-tRNA(Gln) amidotransferase GatCAB subunit C [Deltaproteobacteria bacterium]
MRNITKKEVEQVARLARLSLSDSQLDTMTGQLDTILAYVEKLNELDTTDVSPTTHVFSVSNAFREDLVQPSLPQETSLENAPEKKEALFQVPRII